MTSVFYVILLNILSRLKCKSFFLGSVKFLLYLSLLAVRLDIHLLLLFAGTAMQMFGRYSQIYLTIFH